MVEHTFYLNIKGVDLMNFLRETPITVDYV